MGIAGKWVAQSFWLLLSGAFAVGSFYGTFEAHKRKQ